MSSIPYDATSATAPQAFAVGVESTTRDRLPKAHVVALAMADLGPHGVTACGFPVDRLLLMPDLEWTAIAAAERCEHCSAEYLPGAPGVRASGAG